MPAAIDHDLEDVHQLLFFILDGFTSLFQEFKKTVV
jgi:hypothetical protein